MKSKFKKMYIIVLSIIMLSFVGCGQSAQTNNTKTTPKEWQPKEIAEFNKPYISKNEKNQDGSNSVISVAKIEKKDGNLIITSEAPDYNALKYALDKFLSINPIDIEGKSMASKINNITLNPVNDTTEIIVTGLDTSKIKFVEIGPYKTSNDNIIIFKVD